jgi:ribosomal protein L22
MSTVEAERRGNHDVVQAQAKWVRSSARKARLVTDLIRGRTVPEARTILAFSERAVARDIERVLHSAVSNAEANHNLIGDNLVVVAAYADEGPTMKRWRARARGRVARIRKRTCHITVRLQEPLPQSEPKRRKARSTSAKTKPAAKKAGTKKSTTARKSKTSSRPKKKEAAA